MSWFTEPFEALVATDFDDDFTINWQFERGSWFLESTGGSWEESIMLTHRMEEERSAGARLTAAKRFNDAWHEFLIRASTLLTCRFPQLFDSLELDTPVDEEEVIVGHFLGCRLIFYYECVNLNGIEVLGTNADNLDLSDWINAVDIDCGVESRPIERELVGDESTRALFRWVRDSRNVGIPFPDRLNRDFPPHGGTIANAFSFAITVGDLFRRSFPNVTGFDTCMLDGQAEATSHKRPNNQECDSRVAVLALNLYTDGLVDERFTEVCRILENDSLSANERISKIDALIPIPATVSAEKIGIVLGVSKAAIQKTAWYEKNRRGRKAEEVERRREKQRKRGQRYDSSRRSNGEE